MDKSFMQKGAFQIYLTILYCMPPLNLIWKKDLGPLGEMKGSRGKIIQIDRVLFSFYVPNQLFTCSHDTVHKIFSYPLKTVSTHR